MTRYSTITSGDSVPRVWITLYDYGFEISDKETDEGLAVDMNASLFRQIVAANKKYEKFQHILDKFWNEASMHPNQIRRVR
jgi:hypothetical protein